MDLNVELMTRVSGLPGKGGISRELAELFFKFEGLNSLLDILTIHEVLEEDLTTYKNLLLPTLLDNQRVDNRDYYTLARMRSQLQYVPTMRTGSSFI